MMKWRHVMLMLLAAAACHSREKNLRCDQFRSGTFYMAAQQPGSYVLVVRQENSQTETNEQTGKIIGYKITWSSDCTFELAKTYERQLYIVDSTKPIMIKEFRSSPKESFQIIASGDDYFVVSPSRIANRNVDTIFENAHVGGFKAIGDQFKQD